MNNLYEIRNEWNHIIEGSWVHPDDNQYFDVFEPATGMVFARAANGNEADIDKAVSSAKKAFNKDWRWRAPRERGELLFRAADIIQKNIDELAWIETREVGKPILQSRNADLKACIDTFRYFGGLADKLTGEVIPAGPITAYTFPEPYGVIAVILPFNWPPSLLATKIAPALAAGNTVVVKTPEQAPICVLRIVELLQSIFPASVINAVSGMGAVVGKALVTHPGIGKVTFTGSTNTGRKILKDLAENIIPSTMELGGKNPLLVFEDADLNVAVKGALEGMFFNQGEACTSSSRILLHESISEAFLEIFCKGVENIRVGDGLDESTEMGALITKTDKERVMAIIEKGKLEGGRIRAQSSIPSEPNLKNGYFVPATIFDRVTSDMDIVRNEIFGPVCTVQTFNTYEKAILMANDTEYGLAAGIFSKNLDTIMRASREIEAGVITVNNYHRAWLGTPFGGMKKSGFGRELALESLKDFVRTKNIRIPSGFGEVPHWSVVDRLVK
jgi:acyl-CoA reductase-like NAD-dependent aldehyde dehydrogenase